MRKRWTWNQQSRFL